MFDQTTANILFLIAAEPEYGAALRRRITPVIIGVGPIEAAISATLALQQRVADNRRPDLVVSLGSAGSHRCQVGTIWQIASVSWRDIDASRIGFERGITPFADHPAEIALPTPLPGIPTATLSTGGEVLGDERYDLIESDLADMETFAVVRLPAVRRAGDRVTRGVGRPGHLAGHRRLDRHAPLARRAAGRGSRSHP